MKIKVKVTPIPMKYENWKIENTVKQNYHPWAWIRYNRDRQCYYFEGPKGERESSPSSYYIDNCTIGYIEKIINDDGVKIFQGNETKNN